MNEKKFKSMILKNAEILQTLNDNIKKLFNEKEKNISKWKEACSIFYESYDRLAFPSGLERELKLLKELDPDAIEKSIIYLEIDPYYHRSGYIKEKIIAYLKKVDFNKNQILKLRDILIKSIYKSKKREYKQYCLLAAKLFIDDKSFIDVVKKIKETGDSFLSSQASYFLKILQGSYKSRNKN